MADDEFQANWRGARRYQFDEEARRKKAALEQRKATVHPMRYVKWGDPKEKLKVLVEDIYDTPKSRPWIDQRQARPLAEEKEKVLAPEFGKAKAGTWLDRIPTRSFCLLTCGACLVAFFLATLFG